MGLGGIESILSRRNIRERSGENAVHAKGQRL